MGKGVLDGTDAMLDLSGVATEFLTEGQWGSVHQVGTTDLDDVGHFLCLGVKSLVELAKAWQGHFDDLLVASDVHAGGEGIVGGLGLIDVVIREERLFAFADDLTCELVGTVGDDFVDVHVALRTRARLPDD